MFTAKQFRKKAAESAEALKHTDIPSEIHELQRSEQRFAELAQNETWLADSFDKIARSMLSWTASQKSCCHRVELVEERRITHLGRGHDRMIERPIGADRAGLVLGREVAGEPRRPGAGHARGWR